MIELTSKQRKFLEKSAQPMSPLVLIGGAGVTEEQIKQIQAVIKIHELIKVKFNEFKDEKKELARAIEEKTDSTLVRIIGNVAIFYKEAEKMADRKFSFRNLEYIINDAKGYHLDDKMNGKNGDFKFEYLKQAEEKLKVSDGELNPEK